MWYRTTFASFIGMVVSFLIIGVADDITLRILGGLLLLVSYSFLSVMIYGGRRTLYTGKYSKRRGSKGRSGFA